MRRWTKYTSTILTILLPIWVIGSVIHIPDSLPTIQSGIDTANFGDTVLVSPGVYHENINFNGKNITVGSLFLTTGEADYIRSTIISPNYSRPVTFGNGEDTTACLSGFTLRDGREIGGGGIRCWNSSPLLCNLIIEKNRAWEWGGGICCDYYANPIIRNVIIRNNHCDERGGGIACWVGSSPLIQNTIIANNRTYFEGGGISLMSNCLPKLHNVILIGNSAYRGGGIAITAVSDFNVGNAYLIENHAKASGGAISIDSDSLGYFHNLTIVGNTVGTGGSVFHSEGEGRISILNSIFWQNESPIFSLNQDFTCLIGYSNLDFSLPPMDHNATPNFVFLAGNINTDPQFENFSQNKFDLAASSPCVDAGTSFLTWNGDTLINLTDTDYQGNAPDMGAKESPFVVAISTDSTIPDSFSLYQNYPNPFNSHTTIPYKLSQQSDITLTIYNTAGQRVRVLAREEKSAGSHVTYWDGKDDQEQVVSAGLYFIQLTAAGQIQLTKTLMIK